MMCAVPSMAEQENNAYTLGDKVDDFAVTLFDGTQTTLYELLKSLFCLRLTLPRTIRNRYCLKGCRRLRAGMPS